MDDKVSYIKELICPHCGKNFIYNSRSIYKLRKDNKTIYYCSYTCWIANDTRNYNYVEGRYVD